MFSNTRSGAGALGGFPSAGDIGSHPVTIRAEDSFGAFDTQSYALEVLTEPLEPPYYTARITGAMAHTQGGLVVDTADRYRGIEKQIGTCKPAGDGYRRAGLGH